MPEATPRPAVPGLLVAALVVSAFLVGFGGLHYGFYTQRLLMDTPLYERYGDAIVHRGQVPYRDFAVEYPPGSLPVFAAPSLVSGSGDFSRYARVFEALMLLCGAVASGLVAYLLVLQRAGRIRLVAGTLLAGLAPLALGPVVLSRFDLWPAALVIAALAALVAERRTVACALLGAAIAAKLYPAVLAPLALTYVWRRHGRRELLRCGGVLVGVVAACFLPFVAVSPHGVWESFSGQASRPLQIESVGAAFLLAAHQLGGLKLEQVSSHGSDNLVGALPHALAQLQSLLAAAVFLALWVGYARGPSTRDRFLRFAAAAVCAFVALSKVVSPQYLIWLFALIPLVRGRRGAVAGALFLGAMLLTQLWFPSRYIDLVYGLDARASWFVVGRDLLLVALLATLAWPRGRWRFPGVALVATLVAGSVVAAAAGVLSRPAARALVHERLLTATGVASECATRKRAPESSPGEIAYAATTFPSPPRPACITVALTAPAHAQVFSAAYRTAFDPLRPRARYLGDAGRCTNLAGAAGRRVSYSFELPARSAFAVEAEGCGSSGAVPPYVLDIFSSSVPPVTYRSARAERIGGVVTVRWRTASESRRVSFDLYREDAAGRLAIVGRRVPARSDRRYAYADRRAPTVRSLRYWIRARTSSSSWSWHGPA